MPLQNLMRIPQNNSFEVFSKKTQKTSATKNLSTKKSGLPEPIGQKPSL
jgi:hypothetical protein